MGKFIADTLRHLADSCDESANTDERFDELLSDLNDMKSVVGYMDMRLRDVEKHTSKKDCKIISLNNK